MLKGFYVFYFNMLLLYIFIETDLQLDELLIDKRFFEFGLDVSGYDHVLILSSDIIKVLVLFAKIIFRESVCF